MIDPKNIRRTCSQKSLGQRNCLKWILFWVIRYFGQKSLCLWTLFGSIKRELNISQDLYIWLWKFCISTVSCPYIWLWKFCISTVSCPYIWLWKFCISTGDFTMLWQSLAHKSGYEQRCLNYQSFNSIRCWFKCLRLYSRDVVRVSHSVIDWTFFKMTDNILFFLWLKYPKMTDPFWWNLWKWLTKKILSYITVTYLRHHQGGWLAVWLRWWRPIWSLLVCSNCDEGIFFNIWC